MLLDISFNFQMRWSLKHDEIRENYFEKFNLIALRLSYKRSERDYYIKVKDASNFLVDFFIPISQRKDYSFNINNEKW
jgi:hypothetical protein